MQRATGREEHRGEIFVYGLGLYLGTIAFICLLYRVRFRVFSRNNVQGEDVHAPVRA